MQSDFHFYAIYALARAAGISPRCSFIVAYSSQHTDDAKYDHALNFTNGGRFQQVLTAHKYLDSKALDVATCYRIWVPFHFLPGNQGVDFYERMVTRSASTVAQKLIDDFLTSKSKPFFLHRLGILLHCFADTWSHQNFLGLQRADINNVRHLTVKDIEKTFFKSLLKSLQQDIIEYAAPKLGHAQAGTIPDEPFQEWKYIDYLGKIHDISNVNRFMEAAQNCYQLLTRFLDKFHEFRDTQPILWHNLAERIAEIFETRAPLDERIKKWKDAIAAGEFGGTPKDNDVNLEYHDRNWFNDAVKVEKTQDKPDQYERKPNFETSDWKYFHDAAAFHRFTVLHEVLPEYGMICG